jgi:hypothetical protein
VRTDPFFFLATDRFSQHLVQDQAEGSRTLFEPTQITSTLLTAALEILHSIRKPDLSYRKAGVVLTDITDGTQMMLWANPAATTDKLVSACRAMDEVNRLLHKNAVQFSYSNQKKVWRPAAQKKFTTLLSQLGTVASINEAISCQKAFKGRKVNPIPVLASRPNFLRLAVEQCLASVDVQSRLILVPWLPASLF